MPRKVPITSHVAPPTGGIRGERGRLRAWSWRPGPVWSTAPTRCRSRQWYLLRATPRDGLPCSAHFVEIIFSNAQGALHERVLELQPQERAQSPWLAWGQAPAGATRVGLRLTDERVVAGFGEVTLLAVAERDPKCHPIANVPRWDAYRPPFPIERLVLPTALRRLAPLLGSTPVLWLDAPGSKREFARHAIGAGLVAAPEWIRDLRLTWEEITQIASASWLVIDLETLATLLNTAGVVETQIVSRRALNQIMSARVEYSDAPTRGFALQDVLPFSTIEPDGAFSLRGIRLTRAWKRFANETGFAPLLVSETPWEARRGDLLSAALATEHGELIATDLPWLANGRGGPQLAPDLIRFLTRTHLAQPVEDAMQYWNRWDDTRVVLRDIADLARRYPYLHAWRFSPQHGIARFGLALGAPEAARRCIIASGRIDARVAHDGAPPEPLMIFMKWAARELREGTRFARALRDTLLIWQFDSADGLTYSVLYDAAPRPPAGATINTLQLVNADAPPALSRSAAPTHGARIEVAMSSGLFGNRSFAIQSELTERITAWLARTSERAPTVEAG